MKKLFYILTAIVSLGAKAQQVPAPAKIKQLVTALDNFRIKTPVEKIHVHFDKPYYTLGDTIWFKAYVVNGFNELSPISKVLHVDLVNDRDSAKITLNLPVTRGVAWGNITLRDTLLRQGTYHIRAYTNWMRNFAPDYFFDKAIRIGNALPSAKNTATNDRNRATDISIQFFPEGGELVNGIASKVAFKAVGADGLSREVSGYIIDKNNQQLATFKTEHAGMGSFMLQPDMGNTYTAVVKYPGGNERRLQLPRVAQQGYVLSATQDETNIAVKIKVTGNALRRGNILLVAQANNVVQYAAENELTRTGFSAVIPKNRFPEGVLQLTLFSPDYQPVAERLVYIHHTDKHLNIKLTPDKPDYNARGKVHLNMEVTDRDGTPVVGVFSLAVTDESKVPFAEADERTIFSSLLLSSDLKGYIEQPNYYFTDNNPDKARQLDNLLLTQGWRRFEWKDVQANTFPALTYKSENDMSISGQILSKGKPAPGAKVYLLVNIGDGIVLDTVTNAEGRFRFGDLAFGKNVPFNVSAQDARGNKNVTVKLDEQGYEPPLLKHLPDELPPYESFATYIQSSRKRFNELNKNGLLNNSVVLKEVNIKDIAVKHSNSLAGAGNADQVLTFMDLLGCQYDLSKCLQGRLTDIRFKSDTARGFSNAGVGIIPYSRGYDSPMLVMVDGIERPDGLTNIVSSDVASIEVLRGGGSAALYGLHGGNGVIIVTTKRGDINYIAYEMDRSRSKSGLSTYKFQGYDLRRRFYSPDYDNQLTNTRLADMRSTIYWNPNIITNESGKASVEFFNADGKGNYRIITEGLDLEGKLGRQVARYNVK
jgi:TonB-dependent SusC/RagA subfamily outer membrane receptor